MHVATIILEAEGEHFHPHKEFCGIKSYYSWNPESTLVSHFPLIMGQFGPC